MALFDVPGWGAPMGDVVAGPSSHSGKKRKRGEATTGSTPAEVEAAVRNFQKLVSKLGESGDADDKPDKKKKDNKGKKQRRSIRDRAESPTREVEQPVRKDSTKKSTTKPIKDQPEQSKQRVANESNDPPPSSERPNKKRKNNKGDGNPKSSDAPAVQPQPVKKPKPEPGLTALQNKMKSKLDGARFRWINEQLYKTGSEESHAMMRDDPKVFSEYHSGFRQQVQSWPTNPVSHYISSLSTCPKGTVIADLGCGDAALARALVPKGFCVLSYDLVSDGEFVIESDICEHLPLPGSEGGEKGQVVDVVVCALSLMSTNWVGCMREAWRILKPGGQLLVAEVASRFTTADEFTSLVESIGFSLTSKDESNTHFSLFDFEKVVRESMNEKEWAALSAKGEVLQPCEYKRR